MTGLHVDNQALSALTTAAALTTGRPDVLMYTAVQQDSGRLAQQ